MMLDWRSASLFMTADAAWRRRIFVGGLLLLLPAIGWPLVLGYRRWVLDRLVAGAPKLLPPWHGNLLAILTSGVGAMTVIHVWYSPLYLWLALTVGDAGGAGGAGWIAAGAFVVAFPIFSTLIIPALVAWLRFGAESPPSNLELAAISVAFALITFVIPSGFLQVSRTGRLRSAFRLDRDLRLIRTHFFRYVEAWFGSGVMSLIAHLCIPLSPFGVVWCYLGIVYSFNEVPLDDPDADHLRRSWFRYFRDAHWERYDVRRDGLTEHYARIVDESGPLGRGAASFTCVPLGPLRVPLPGST